MSNKRFRLATVIRLLVVAFVIQVFLIPQIGGARKALHTIGDINPIRVVIVVLLEALAIIAYAELTRVFLTDEHRPGLGTCTGVTLASLGVSHVVPGGAATTVAVNYRLYGRAGVPGTELGFALAAQAIGSAIILNLILWTALVWSIPVRGFQPGYATAAAIGAILMIASAAAVVGLMRGEDAFALRAAAFVSRLPKVEEDAVERGIRTVATQLRNLVEDPARLRRGSVIAAVNWLLDAAALWVALTAFGHSPGIVGLLVAYGLANVMAAVPITPGGLGVIEAVLIPTLVAFGAPASVAAVGVVAYRMVNFWLPIPVGFVAYTILDRRLAFDTPDHGVRPALDDLTDP